VLKFNLQALSQSPQHLYEKRKGSRAGSGSVRLTNGSGSGRRRNMRIIRIPNTVCETQALWKSDMLHLQESSRRSTIVC